MYSTRALARVWLAENLEERPQKFKLRFTSISGPNGAALSASGGLGKGGGHASENMAASPTQRVLALRHDDA